MITLPPIRLDYQIEDAISGYEPKNLADKLAALKPHLDAITTINGVVVYKFLPNFFATPTF